MPDLPLTWVDRFLYPPLFVTVLWCLLTVGLLWINRGGRHVARVALFLTLPVLLTAHWLLYTVRNDMSVLGVYIACGSAFLIWSWHELAFYSGVISGIWRQNCPPHVHGRERFTYALATHIYHELAAAIEVIALLHIHRDATNVIGPLTFVLLWMLLHSAKLNVFLGVRHLTLDWLPDHLAYLGSFWKRRTSNPLLIAFIMLYTGIASLLWYGGSTIVLPNQAISFILLATLATLGMLEHMLLMVPLGEQQQQAATPLGMRIKQ